MEEGELSVPRTVLASTVSRLGPMDYSIWHSVVSALPTERFSSKVALKAAIARAFALVAASNAPDKAVSAFKNRLQQCLGSDGGHFEA